MDPWLPVVIAAYIVLFAVAFGIVMLIVMSIKNKKKEK